jgi:hypothetical protein
MSSLWAFGLFAFLLKERFLSAQPIGTVFYSKHDHCNDVRRDGLLVVPKFVEIL